MAGRWFQDKVVQADGRTQLAMVHYWLIPNPKGRFASHNPTLAYLDLGLPTHWAGDMEVARGLALAQRGGCDKALDAEFWLSGAPRAKSRGIKRACEEIADGIRAVLGKDRATIEATARAGWTRLEDIRFLNLTPDERRRMSAFVEDGPGICR